MKLSYNDEEHAYWLDGKRCKGVTSVAKMPDDTYGLDRWRERQVVIGLAKSAPLVHQAAAHFDQRDKLDRIVKEALAIAKANEKADRGTADHRLTERFDLGLDWIDTPQAQAVRAAWTAALDHAGIDIDPQLVERIVVHPDQLIAGRFDRIGRYRRTGRPVVVDVKTGENAIKYPHSTSVQLGLYANAPWMAGPLRPGKPGSGTEWTDTFEPLPDDLHTDHAIVVYLPPEGPARCYRLDIAAGWETARTICFPTIAWRKTDGLVEEITDQAPALAHSGPAATAERVAWLYDRIHLLVDKGLEGELASIWHTDLVAPPITHDTALTDTQVDTVVGWCAYIEGLHGIPFPPMDPLFASANPPGVIDTPPPATQGPDGEQTGSDNGVATELADRARTLLAEFDPDQVKAILDAAYMTGTETMTPALYERVEAIAAQVANPAGILILTYSETGPAVAITDLARAEEAMSQIAGGRGEARDRAARIAKQCGRIAPRSLTKAAETPLYAALVAAGHGANHNTNNNSQEQPA